MSQKYANINTRLKDPIKRFNSHLHGFTISHKKNKGADFSINYVNDEDNHLISIDFFLNNVNGEEPNIERQRMQMTYNDIKTDIMTIDDFKKINSLYAMDIGKSGLFLFSDDSLAVQLHLPFFLKHFFGIEYSNEGFDEWHKMFLELENSPKQKDFNRTKSKLDKAESAYLKELKSLTKEDKIEALRELIFEMEDKLEKMVDEEDDMKAKLYKKHNLEEIKDVVDKDSNNSLNDMSTRFREGLSIIRDNKLSIEPYAVLNVITKGKVVN